MPKSEKTLRIENSIIRRFEEQAIRNQQQAEIEHSEIIFTLEVTKKLEEYYEIFYSEESSTKEKEQAAIDAGKLLVFQILEILRTSRLM